MITSIEIENLRGIRSSKLEGLAPLTVLTGPNGCGKSTVLEALFIAASPNPGDAVGQAVERHTMVQGGPRWLFNDHLKSGLVQVETLAGGSWIRTFDWINSCYEDLRNLLQIKLENHAQLPFTMIKIGVNSKLHKYSGETFTAFDINNVFVTRQIVWPKTFASYQTVQFVDPGRPTPLHRMFSAVAQSGRRDSVYDLLRQLIRGFERLEILTGVGDRPILHIQATGDSVPVGLAGEGIQGFVQLALEMAVVQEGLVLLEEPEVYQHPKAIWRTAQALLANCRRGVQIVLSTHSLELIDALGAQATPEDLQRLALFNLKLENGELRYSHYDGEEIVFNRQTLENDLR